MYQEENSSPVVTPFEGGRQQGGDDQRQSVIARESAAVRVLIYTHDTFGLGNIRRMLAIAEHLVASDQRLHVLLITGSPMLQGFRVSPRIDFIKLPCLDRDQAGTYQVRSLPLQVDEVLRMRSDLIRSTLLSFQPDLLLVDKNPLGVGGELAPVLETLDELPNPPAVALLLRDILDEPETTSRIWERSGYHEVIRRHYDLVLVAGQPDIFDMAAEYRFPSSTRRLLRYCGYIQRRNLQSSASRPVASSPGILVSVGGGGDGSRLIRCFLEGLRQNLSRHQNLRSTVITGPEMPASERAHIEGLARGMEGLTLHEFCSDLPSVMADADLVIGMCGYNSACEILASRKRAIAVPRVEPVQEQLIRAERFSRRGLLTLLHPEQLTPATLMRSVDDALASRPLDAFRVLDFGGLDRIQYWLHRLLDQRGQYSSSMAQDLCGSEDSRKAAHV